MSLLDKLFGKLKPKAAPAAEAEKNSVKKSPEEPGLDEEMVSDGVEMEPMEKSGLPEIFEKAGEEEQAKEEQKDGEPPENKPENKKE